MLIATAGVAFLFAILGIGVRQNNSLSWGVGVSLALLPVLFIVYAMVTVFAKVFCDLGNSMLGPLDTSAAVTVVVKRQPVMPEQEPESNIFSNDEATDGQ